MVVLGVCAIVFAGMEDVTSDLVLYRFWGRDFLSCPWMCLPGSSRFLLNVSNPLLWRFGLLILNDFTPFHFSPAEPILGWSVSNVKGWTSFTMSIDAFKGWALFYFVVQLMISRGGSPLLNELIVFLGWSPNIYELISKL